MPARRNGPAVRSTLRADSVTPLKQQTARNHSKRSKLAAKSQSALTEWLARRERDGFRN